MKSRMRDMDLMNKKLIEEDSWADTDLLLNPDDRIMLRKIGDYIRAQADIEEVKSDPLFDMINGSSRELVTGSTRKHGSDRRYIIESLAENEEYDNTADEIRNIKIESKRLCIDKVTSEWVKDWNERSRSDNPENGQRKEIRDFITGSPENIVIGRERKKVFPLRWILTSAAALLGAIIIIRALLPPDNPDRIFAKYYEPMNIVSSVTRGANTVETDRYALAVESYKAHNYQEAAAGFSLAAEPESQAGPALFFLGLSQMALTNYGEAVAVLENVVPGQGEYVKDATWYLGLAYIKTGDPGKAKICFETLSRTSGFYSDRSREILRRLK
jgi:hypothetical protein